MTFYQAVLVIHILGGGLVLGSAAAIVTLLKQPLTVAEANFSIGKSEAVEKAAIAGSISAFVTGILMGILSPHYFTLFWFDASLILFLLIQPIVIVILPKIVTKQKNILLNEASEDTLPESYHTLAKKALPYHYISIAAAVLLVILMTVKPF